MKSSDHTIRALAGWTIGLLGVRGSRSRLEALLTDDTEVQLYMDHKLVVRRVSEIAIEALARSVDSGTKLTQRSDIP